MTEGKSVAIKVVDSTASIAKEDWDRVANPTSDFTPEFDYNPFLKYDFFIKIFNRFKITFF